MSKKIHQNNSAEANDIIDFQKLVLSWYSQFGRKNLPWQENPTAYRVWVSEIMLQQTQVNTVIPYYLKFMAAFPTVTDLAKATDDQVMALWSGLGYYSRARNLHKTARTILASPSTENTHYPFPETLDHLQSLPGIGRSTAAAILALAMQKRAAILDGNVKRVLARCFAVSGWPGKASVNNKLWQIAEKLTPENQVRDYTQAMMDLGATICTRSNPNCNACPIESICVAHKEDNQPAYPEKKKKVSIPTKQQFFYLITNNDQLLMEKRPPTGIWGGLWTPPTCDITEDGERYLMDSFGIEVSTIIKLPNFKHTFSHFHLQLHPVKAEINSNISHRLSLKEDNLRWDKIDNWLNQGIPAPVRIMLQQLSTDIPLTD